ncbi:MAG: hypothetical protein A2178_02780 [Planctomycetes bacterium GWC2_49_10]|nr:MAG: hypothetical protein A2178_02780 [Planctomycetes bacterium GWC2_49_10]
MNGITLEDVWLKSDILRSAFEEYRECLKEVQGNFAYLFECSAGRDGQFEVKLGEFPDDQMQLRRNLFSTLFQSVYHILEIEPARRILYGQINHLFRIWVTSADNLLDKEDKVVLPIELPGRSHVMHQVVAVMAADRVLAKILHEAVSDRRISDIFFSGRTK